MRRPGQNPQERNGNLANKDGWTIFSRFFNGDEAALLNDLRIDRGVFNLLLNAVEDLHIQTRGRRSLIHPHRGQLLFLRVFPVSGRASSRCWRARGSSPSARCTGWRCRSCSSATSVSRPLLVVIPHQQLLGYFLSPVPRGWPILRVSNKVPNVFELLKMFCDAEPISNIRSVFVFCSCAITS